MTGKSVVINKKGVLTNGNEAKILGFDIGVGKYEVAFGNSWVGWYKWSELDVV